MQYYFEAISPGSALPWEVTVTVFKHLSKTSHQQINQISLMDKKQHLAFHPWLVSAGLICKCDKHVFKLSLKFMALQHRPWSKAAAVPNKATQQRKLSSAKANCSQILIWTQTSIILNETWSISSKDLNLIIAATVTDSHLGAFLMKTWAVYLLSTEPG